MGCQRAFEWKLGDQGLRTGHATGKSENLAGIFGLLEPQFSSLTRWGQAGRIWISAFHLGVCRVRTIT